MAIGKDDYRFQQARIERIAEELSPGCTVEFDPERVPTWIRFRILSADRVVLAVSSGEWHVSEIADRTDKWLRGFIQQIGGGRI